LLFELRMALDLLGDLLFCALDLKVEVIDDTRSGM
jgi:hypothetical protein